MDLQTRQALLEAAQRYGTPCYVYFIDAVRRRFEELAAAFGERLQVSYAVKANPNRALLDRMRDHVASFDVSSIGEVERCLALGFPAECLNFSGPVKRVAEIERAVAVDLGAMVCESDWEIGELDRLAAAAGKRMKFLIRINPRRVPRKFGLNMGGRGTQFGIDEESLEATLQHLSRWPNLQLQGFHVYSATNSLDADAIAENFDIMIELFVRFADAYALTPTKLVFGSGFGVPYQAEHSPLDLTALARQINPKIDALKRHPRMREAQCVLEMGRFLVAAAGYFVTSVINEKSSRGTEIRMCDGGFNNHLAACGMMGAIIRRNWTMEKVNLSGRENLRKYLITGPLCTTIDALAMDVELPELRRGDLLAVGCSGAYGLSASPVNFISHPLPREVLVQSGTLVDVTDRATPPS
jgi:diaminopimelate decarboxylase